MPKYKFAIFILMIFLACNNKLNDLKEERDKVSNEIEDLTNKLENINQEIYKINPKDETPPKVSIKNIDFESFEHYIDLQCNLSTNQNVMLNCEYPGTIILNVKEGQTVSAGQVIASISDGGLSQQMQQSKIQLNLAQVAFEKQKRLWDQSIGSEMQYLQAKTNAESMNKQLKGIQQQMQKTKLKAAFSGTIDKILVQSGQAVMPGIPLIQLVSNESLKAIAEIPEEYSSRIKKGSKVVLKIPSIDRTIYTNINLVSSNINPNNRTYRVEIPIVGNKSDLKSNMIANAKIVDYSNTKAILVPNSALKQNANNEYYVLRLLNQKNNTAIANKTFVTIGYSNEEKTEIKSGLNIGDIISINQESIFDKSKVLY